MSPYKNKKIAIVGLSIEGRDSAIFFVGQGATVYGLDRRTKAELGALYDELARLGITFRLGNTYLADLSSYDLVVRSQGIALWLPEVETVSEKARKLTSNTKLFFSLCKAPIIGVTATKGKGTTSTLIFEMLRLAGKRVYLGGNVGTPLLSAVPDIDASSWVVLELSSFQLEDLGQSPHIAVVGRITQDHLANVDPLATNYHKSRDDYVRAKSSLVRFQKPGDTVVVHADDPTSRSFGELSPGKKYSVTLAGTSADAWVDRDRVWVNWQGKTEEICWAGDIKLLGRHNLENIALAALAALSAGVPLDAVREVTKTFKGLPHRLEVVGIAGDVTYVDDSFSTVPETTIAAVASFTRPITLIVGGSEKGSNYSVMGEYIAKSTVGTLIVIGQMTERIVASVKTAGYTGKIITGCKTMKEIVTRATAITQPGGVVLLSPGCASFDMFTNYKDRGEQFAYEVSRL